MGARRNLGEKGGKLNRGSSAESLRRLRIYQAGSETPEGLAIDRQHGYKDNLLPIGDARAKGERRSLIGDDINRVRESPIGDNYIRERQSLLGNDVTRERLLPIGDDSNTERWSPTGDAGFSPRDRRWMIRRKEKSLQIGDMNSKVIRSLIGNTGLSTRGRRGATGGRGEAVADRRHDGKES